MITIRMNRGVTYVSTEDAELAGMRWRLAGAGYAARDVGERKIYLHRVVAERAGLTVEGAQVDHIDGDRLNNTRPNLRVVTAAQNQHNRRIKRTGSSRFKGVSWAKAAQRWSANIRVSGVQKWLGYFVLEIMAAAAYARAAQDHFGAHAAPRITKSESECVR